MTSRSYLNRNISRKKRSSTWIFHIPWKKKTIYYVVEGPKIEKMLGYTNLDSEKGFAFFQKFLKETGILEQLENAGIQEGDTVRMYGLQFEYYR